MSKLLKTCFQSGKGRGGYKLKKLEIRKTINSVKTLRRLPVVRAVSVSKGAVKVFEKHIIC